MAITLNHTIVRSRNKVDSANFLTRILGLGPPVVAGHFIAVELENGVTLDYDDAGDVSRQHYAFLVSEDAFDGIFERVLEEHVSYYADPGHRRAGVINTRGGGRGFYFDDPNGHHLEILTRA